MWRLKRKRGPKLAKPQGGTVQYQLTQSLYPYFAENIVLAEQVKSHRASSMKNVTEEIQNLIAVGCASKVTF